MDEIYEAINFTRPIVPFEFSPFPRLLKKVFSMSAPKRKFVEFSTNPVQRIKVESPGPYEPSGSREFTSYIILPEFSNLERCVGGGVPRSLIQGKLYNLSQTSELSYSQRT